MGVYRSIPGLVSRVFFFDAVVLGNMYFALITILARGCLGALGVGVGLAPLFCGAAGTLLQKAKHSA